MAFESLRGITSPTPISALSEDQVRELQLALLRLGYPVGPVDGLLGNRTKSAWAEFKTDIFQGNPDLIGAAGVAALLDRLEHQTAEFDGDVSTPHGVIEAIKAKCHALGLGLPAQIAYVLATTQWETNQSFKPVEEAYWLGHAAQQNYLRTKRYYPYYGRGYVQLTWKRKYELFSNLTGHDLVQQPELASQHEIALFVLVHGFKVGSFTGRKLEEYVNGSNVDFVKARRCINGTDKSYEIAELANRYLSGIS